MIAGCLNHLLGPTAFPQCVKGLWDAMVAEGRYRHPPDSVVTFSGSLFNLV